MGGGERGHRYSEPVLDMVVMLYTGYWHQVMSQNKTLTMI